MHFTATVTEKRAMEAKYLRLSLSEDEVGDLENTENQPFPAVFKKGDRYEFSIDLDTGRICDWPFGTEIHLHCKPRDDAQYYLIGPDESVLAKLIDEYVPECVATGDGGGDYIDFSIGGDGYIDSFLLQCQPEVLSEDFFPTGD